MGLDDVMMLIFGLGRSCGVSSSQQAAINSHMASYGSSLSASAASSGPSPGIQYSNLEQFSAWEARTWMVFGLVG